MSIRLTRVYLREPITDLGGSKVIMANETNGVEIDYDAGMITVVRTKSLGEEPFLIPMGNVAGMRPAPLEAKLKAK